MEISRKSSDLEPTNSQNFYEQTKSRLTGLFRKIFCLDDQLINDFQPKKIMERSVFDDDAYEGVTSSYNDVFSNLYKP